MKNKVRKSNYQEGFRPDLLPKITNSFIEEHRHPIFIVQHTLYNNDEILYGNNCFHKTFQLKKGNKINLHSFLTNFLFDVEPVKILASENNIAGLHKKSNIYFEFITQRPDNEYIIKELKKLENVNKSNLFRDDVLNDFPEIIFEINQELNFNYLNKKALEIFGIKNHELQNNIALKQIFNEIDFKRIRVFIKSIFAGKDFKEKIIPVIDNKGETLYLEVFFSAIKKKNSIEGIRGIGINITHRRKIEEKLIEAKQKIEDADKLKTSFLMNMSHEIRTPLNSVLGYTQLLQRKISDPELSTFLQSIKSSGKGLLQLFNDLIDLSKIYANQLDIIPTEVNLNNTLQKLEKEFLSEIEVRKKDIELRLLMNCSFAVDNVLLDDDRLRQIFTGLFKNALRFTQEGFIEFGYQCIDNKLHFFMKDTGEGIDKVNQKRIFDLFYQPPEKDGQERRGTGIGLAIIKGILDKMKGKIWLESEKGKGALFNFTLPLITSDKEQNHVNKEKKRLNGLLNKHILIVEDDIDNFLILKSFLKNTKAIIHHIDNGKEALTSYQNYNSDIIFMDINLPGIDGCEVTREIRKKNKNVIIIAQSAYVTQSDRQACFDAGCDAFIEKPIYGDMLMSTLSMFLEKNNRK